MKKIYTEEERKEARRLSVKKYNDKVKEKNKKRYQENKEEYKKKYKKYYKKNKEQIKLNVKQYRDANIEKVKAKEKEYYEKNKEKLKEKNKEYRENNKEHKKEYDKQYRENNKDKINITKQKRKKERLKNDPLYKLTCAIRRNINKALKTHGYTKKSRTHEIIGCSFEELKEHIESQWEGWMTWDNYGLYNGELNYGWDIDHIIPISSAIDEENIIRLNHYTNMQPLCSRVNRDIKKDNIEVKICGYRQ